MPRPTRAISSLLCLALSSLPRLVPAQTVPAQTSPAQTLPAQTLPAQTLPAQAPEIPAGDDLPEAPRPAAAPRPPAGPSGDREHEALWVEGLRALRQGHPALAAQKLAALSRKLQSVVPEAELQLKLAEAEALCGRLAITADVLNAQVLVDGQLVGTTPLPRAHYVAEGMHSVELRIPNEPPSKRSVTVPRGTAIAVDFRVEAGRQARRADARAAALMGTAEGQRSPGRDVSGAKTWHAIALTTGTALSLGALTLGFLAHLDASDHDIEADFLRARLQGVPDESGQPCSPGTLFLDTCRQMEREQLDAYDAKLKAQKFFIAFGALSALTLTYAAILLSSDDEPPRAALQPGFGVSASGAEVSLSTRF